MQSIHPLLALGILVLLAPPGMVQGQTKTEFDALKAEVAELKKQVESLKTDLAIVKQAAPQRKTNLEVRFDAASNLVSYADQQAAYEKLAVDAARQGDLKFTKNCIDKISNYAPRQTAMYKSSLLLALAGLEKDGLELAKSLGETAPRNKALLKIARGELDD